MQTQVEHVTSQERAEQEELEQTTSQEHAAEAKVAAAEKQDSEAKQQADAMQQEVRQAKADDRSDAAKAIAAEKHAANASKQVSRMQTLAKPKTQALDDHVDDVDEAEQKRDAYGNDGTRDDAFETDNDDDSYLTVCNNEGAIDFISTTQFPMRSGNSAVDVLLPAGDTSSHEDEDESRLDATTAAQHDAGYTVDDYDAIDFTSTTQFTMMSGNSAEDVFLQAVDTNYHDDTTKQNDDTPHLPQHYDLTVDDEWFEEWRQHVVSMEN